MRDALPEWGVCARPQCRHTPIRVDVPAGLLLFPGHPHRRLQSARRRPVGPIQQEQVREAGDRRAQVRARAALPRARASERPSRPRTRSAIGMSVTWKPVPKMIVSTSCSVPSPVTIECGRTSRMPSVHDLDVGLRERRVVVVGDQDALAAHRVVGRELRAQLGVGDLRFEVLQRAIRSSSHARRGCETAKHEQLARTSRSARAAIRAAAKRRYGDSLARCSEGADAARDDPRRRALEDVQPPDLRLDLRHELDRRRAGADHGDALARRGRGRGPSARSGRRALEGLEARDVRDRRLAQRPHPATSRRRR